MLAGRLRRPGPRSRALPIRLVRALWTLPTNLLGHLAGLLASGRLPRRVGGRAAVGWLYPIRAGLGLDWVGAVTIGHAILHRPGVLDGPTKAARLTLAHELAHTCQHDWLGPLYLPLHLVSQAASAMLTRGKPISVSRVHDCNLLEQTWIAIPSSAPHEPGASDDEVAEVLAAFGV
ncbi:MAG TPA: DUF4157 domain-containing protein [Polyangia bacterium]